MADEETNSEGADDSVGSESTGEDPKHARILKDLQKWKATAREATGKLAEIERQRQDAEAERERASGDLQAQIKRMEARARDMESELAKANATIDGFHRQRREATIVDRLATEGGITNRALLARSLDLAGIDGDADPEALSDGDVKAAIKSLRKQAPELFGTTTNTIKPPPGGGQRPNDDKNSDEYWKQKGQAFSARQGHQPYFSARDSGRK